MSERSYWIEALDDLIRHDDLLPPQLQTLLAEAKETIQSVADETFVLQTDGVVTQPAAEQPPAPPAADALYRLTQQFDELERISDHHGQERAAFRSAVNRLKGLLDITMKNYPE